MSSSRPSLRRVAALAILLAWAGALGWLGRRELGQTEASTLAARAALRLAPSEAWFAVMAGETQVGLVGVTLDTLSPGYKVLETSSMELPRGTALQRTNRTTEITLAPNLAVSSIATVTSSPGRRVATDLTVRGTRITTTITTEGRVVTAESAEGEAPVPMQVAPYRLAFTGALGVGEERRLPLMSGWPIGVRAGRADPSTTTERVVFADSSVLEADRVWRAVLTDTTDVRTILLELPTGTVQATVDGRGGLVGLRHALGVRWQRTDFGIALQAFRERLDEQRAGILAALPTLVPLAALPSGPESDERMHRFEVRHRDGRPLEEWALQSLEGGRQRVRSDGVVTIVESGAAGPRGPGPEILDPLIQVTAPEIVAFAAQLKATITAGDWTRLVTELGRSVRVDTAATAAEDALGALTAGRARPDGVARLLVAVLRAEGANARYVVGVRPSGDTLYTHAWVEVYVRERGQWMAIDPARGHAAAATDLIRLAWAGSSHPDDLLPYVADVRFTPVATPSTEREEQP